MSRFLLPSFMICLFLPVNNSYSLENNKDSFKVTCESQTSENGFKWVWNTKERECYRSATAELPITAAKEFKCDSLPSTKDYYFSFDRVKNDCVAISLKGENSNTQISPTVLLGEDARCETRKKSGFTFSWNYEDKVCNEIAVGIPSQTAKEKKLTQDYNNCLKANTEWIRNENKGVPGLKWEWLDGKCENKRPGTLFAKIKNKFQSKKQKEVLAYEDAKKLKDKIENNQFVPKDNSNWSSELSKVQPPATKVDAEYIVNDGAGWNSELKKIQPPAAKVDADYIVNEGADWNSELKKIQSPATKVDAEYIESDAGTKTTIRLPAEEKKKDGILKKSVGKIKGFFQNRKDRREAANELLDERVCVNHKEMGYKFSWNMETKACDRIDLVKVSDTSDRSNSSLAIEENHCDTMNARWIEEENDGTPGLKYEWDGKSCIDKKTLSNKKAILSGNKVSMPFEGADKLAAKIEKEKSNNNFERTPATSTKFTAAMRKCEESNSRWDERTNVCNEIFVKKPTAIKGNDKNCDRFNQFGSEDEYDECIENTAAHLNPKFLGACNSVKESNPDVHKVCLENLRSTSMDNNCLLVNNDFPKLQAECLSKSEKSLLSKVITSPPKNKVTYMTFNKANGFETELKKANDPVYELLIKCTTGLRNNSSISINSGDQLIYRTTLHNKQNPLENPPGYIFNFGNDKFSLSDYEINEAFNKTCSKRLKCEIFTKVGRSYYSLKIEKNKLNDVPTNISISQTTVEHYMNKDLTLIKADRLSESEKGYANAQLSRAVAVALSDDFLEYRKATSEKKVMTLEAYNQANNTIKSCTELMTQMAPDDKVTIAHAEYAKDAVRQLYDAGKRDIASELQLQKPTTSER